MVRCPSFYAREEMGATATPEMCHCRSSPLRRNWQSTPSLPSTASSTPSQSSLHHHRHHHHCHIIIITIAVTVNTTSSPSPSSPVSFSTCLTRLTMAPPPAFTEVFDLSGSSADASASASSYPQRNFAPRGHIIDNLAKDRLRAFTSGGQFQ